MNLKKSLKDYKSNFRSILAIFFIFVILPALLISGISYVWAANTEIGELLAQKKSLENEGGQIAQEVYLLLGGGKEYSEEQINSQAQRIYSIDSQVKEINAALVTYNLVIFLLSTLFLFAAIWGYAGFISSSTLNKKFSFKQSVKLGKRLYWKYLGLFLFLGAMFMIIGMIVYFVCFLIIVGILGGEYLLQAIVTDLSSVIWIVLILIILLIAAEAPLFIYFMFSPYALAENRKVFASLGTSWKTVRGRWWKTFRNVLLLGILILLLQAIYGIIFYFAIGAPTDILSFVAQISEVTALTFSLGAIWQIIYYLFLIPVSILFFKNLYLCYKKEKLKRN